MRRRTTVLLVLLVLCVTALVGVVASLALSTDAPRSASDERDLTGTADMDGGAPGAASAVAEVDAARERRRVTPPAPEPAAPFRRIGPSEWHFQTNSVATSARPPPPERTVRVIAPRHAPTGLRVIVLHRRRARGWVALEPVALLGPITKIGVPLADLDAVRVVSEDGTWHGDVRLPRGEPDANVGAETDAPPDVDVQLALRSLHAVRIRVELRAGRPVRAQEIEIRCLSTPRVFDRRAFTDAGGVAMIELPPGDHPLTVTVFGDEPGASRARPVTSPHPGVVLFLVHEE